MMSYAKTPPQKLAIAVSVFFFWGFVAASNGIFIPFCKTHFHLSQLQSQLIDTAYYGAYFYGALGLYLISYFLGRDVINQLGYKNTIVLGIALSAIGSLMLYFFAGMAQPSFNLILVAFFVIALGFSLQQTGAQPFLATMGTDETGSHRLNLGGSLNSFGTLLGPIIVSAILFKGAQHVDIAHISIVIIQNLYLFLTALFLLLGVVLYVATFPQVQFSQKIEKSSKGLLVLILIGLIVPLIIFVEELSVMLGMSKSALLLLSTVVMLGLLLFGYRKSQQNHQGWGAIQFPQLFLGMIAIFVCVGVEVSVQSNMGAYLKNTMNLDPSQIANYVSLYWGSMMIGRFVGAISIFGLSRKVERILYYVVSMCAFGIIVLVNFLTGNDVSQFGYYIPFIIVIMTFFLAAQSRPDKSLIILCAIGTLLMLIAMVSPNQIGVFSLAAGGLCCSVLWPCVFSMAIAGLKEYTSQGSALLVMMILGGAVLPPLQGAICDIEGTFLGMSMPQFSYLVPAVGFAYLSFHGYISGQILKKQGIDLQLSASRH